MCGIFGIISKKIVPKKDLRNLALFSRERGKDSSGFLKYDNHYSIERFNKDIKYTINKISISKSNLVIGHSRLITNSTNDNQPIIRNKIVAVHNGIIVNHQNVFDKFKLKRKLKIDTEIIPVLVDHFLKEKMSYNEIINSILSECEGIISCAASIPKLGKLLLFSNNGSLYFGTKNNNSYFASDKFFLKKLNCSNISQIKQKIIDIPVDEETISLQEDNKNRKDIVPYLTSNKKQKDLLIFEKHNLKRCTKCILPTTMPFIKFDEMGICNYCNNYKNRNIVKYNSFEIDKIFENYRKYDGNPDCIVPLSGGRDSSITLHIAKKELNLNPISITYDWGLITDLARRNISRLCSKLNVENIIIADDITKKRSFISRNIKAWLKKPHLGMVNLFTAGDKHFFRHVKNLKKRRDIKLDLMGTNPYEITHFKSGYLGIEPEFEKKKVYTSGLYNQIRYHSKRTYQMLRNPDYLNRSIFDHIYGEIHRSIIKKKHHYSIFDFWRWNENKVEKTLELYDWEKSIDTQSTWRIGDGAAAFYNYIFFTFAGFSEYDTFRSNQIREGDITRSEALELVNIENKPRYENLKWFLEIMNLDFEITIRRINEFRLNQKNNYFS